MGIFCWLKESAIMAVLLYLETVTESGDIFSDEFYLVQVWPSSIGGFTSQIVHPDHERDLPKIFGHEVGANEFV